MVMKVNKKLFVKELANSLDLSVEEGYKINKIIEDNFIISKNSKDRIIEALINELSYDENLANKIYDTSVRIISREIKNSLMHPFKSKDSQ